jgi:plasmid stabilization system protein ParE
MKLEILDEAEEELRQAAQWYEQRKTGLGHIFLDQLWDGFDQITKHPRRYSEYSKSRSREIRRVLMVSFPYAIIYELIGDQPLRIGRRTYEEKARILAEARTGIINVTWIPQFERFAVSSSPAASCDTSPNSAISSRVASRWECVPSNGSG